MTTASFAVPILFLLALPMSSSDDLTGLLHDARQTYDLTAARQLRLTTRAAAQVSQSPQAHRLVAEACLLVAELQRIEFEETPGNEAAERRRLGKLIDGAANEGLAALDHLEPDSDALRMSADLLATLMRSKFRGKKYIGKFNATASRAIELDPNNALAHVTLAKPFLFRPGRNEADLRAGLKLLEEALALDPDLETARTLRGRGRAELGQTREAIDDWRAVLEANPHCTPARVLLDEHTSRPEPASQ